MKIHGNFIRFGLEVDQDKGFYDLGQKIHFGDPKEYLIEIIEEASGSSNDLDIPKHAAEYTLSVLTKLGETLRNDYGYKAKWHIIRETWLPPTRIRIYSVVTRSSLILRKCSIPKNTSLYEVCKARNVFKKNEDDRQTNILYLPIEVYDLNGQPESLVDGNALYSTWMARLPDLIVGFPYELSSTLEATYTGVDKKVI